MGLSTANEIRKSLSESQVKITVIDKKDWFMVGFAKLWIINGTRTFENSIGSLNELEKKESISLKDEITKLIFKTKMLKLKIKKPYHMIFLLISMGAVLGSTKNSWIS